MLRNHHTPHITTAFPVLNEVLSLNAQEFTQQKDSRFAQFVLNEVLSLNAQESTRHASTTGRPDILNEVLSLNAQECLLPAPLSPYPRSPQ